MQRIKYFILFSLCVFSGLSQDSQIILGTWYQNGDSNHICNITQTQDELIFNVPGFTSGGFFTAANKVYASDWEAEGVISEDGKTIYWVGQQWTREPINYNYPDIEGTWHSDVSTQPITISQTSGQVNILFNGTTFVGYFQSQEQIYVNEWNAYGQVASDKISWSNQTWTRNQVNNSQLPNLTGTYYINGHEFQKATITQNGKDLIIQSQHGRSSGEVIDNYRIFASDWNAHGNITINGITWNNQTWFRTPQNISYPNIEGVYSGTQNEKIKITQNGNRIKIEMPNSHSDGYFYDQNYIYAEAWGAYGQIENNSLKWNNQSWIFIDALKGAKPKKTRSDPESDPVEPCNECCKKCRKICNNENASYLGICIAGQVYGDHCDCGN